MRFLTILSFVFFFSFNSIADWQWVTIEFGSFMGQGQDRDRWTAIHECQDDMKAKYVAQAQKCCQNTDAEWPQYRGSCAGGYSGGPNRSFSGGLMAYFCWPSGRIEYTPASGYYWVWETRSYQCQELRNVAGPVAWTPPTAPTMTVPPISRSLSSTVITVPTVSPIPSYTVPK